MLERTTAISIYLCRFAANIIAFTTAFLLVAQQLLFVMMSQVIEVTDQICFCKTVTTANLKSVSWYDDGQKSYIVYSCLKRRDQFLSFTLLFAPFFPDNEKPPGPTTVFHGSLYLFMQSVCLHSCVALFSNTLEGASA